MTKLFMSNGYLVHAIIDWYVIKIISKIESSKNGTYSIKTQHPSWKKKKKNFLKKKL